MAVFITAVAPPWFGLEAVPGAIPIIRRRRITGHPRIIRHQAIIRRRRVIVLPAFRRQPIIRHVRLSIRQTDQDPVWPALCRPMAALRQPWNAGSRIETGWRLTAEPVHFPAPAQWKRAGGIRARVPQQLAPQPALLAV